MSRAAPSLTRTLASSSRTVNPLQVSRRTLFGDAVRPTASTTVSGSTTSVDPRILSGIPSFLPKQNMDMLCEWQSGLWTRLQAEVRNKPELLDVKQKWDRTGLDVTYLLTQTARDPSLAVAFNYASLLLNNSYFLEGLHGNEQPYRVPDYCAHLEDKVEAYAEGMIGSGWLWLVRTGDNHGDIDVFPSFAAGTLLVTNRAQQGRDEIPLFGTPSSSSDESEIPQPSDAPSGEVVSKLVSGLGDANKAKKAFKPTAAGMSSPRPFPLAVLNLFGQSYLGEKYGVWGRGQYAKDWFRSLNWNTVERRSGGGGRK